MPPLDRAPLPVIFIVLGFGLHACKKITTDLEGLPCHEEKGCVAGFECHPLQQRCVRPVPRDCDDPQAVCWIEISAGAECEVEGGFLPCGPTDDCVNGCRTCEAGAWTECEGGEACVPVGSGELCDGKDNDCDQLVDELTPTETNADCNNRVIDAHVTLWECRGQCEIDVCDTGYVDADGAGTTGCEYACSPTSPDTEICDGLDNDCDGSADGADADLDEPAERAADCESRLESAANVSRWGCEAGACVIETCEPGWVDQSGGVGDGCETACTEDNGGVEECDGEDDDCNGTTDDLDPAAVAAHCSGLHPTAPDVAAWACEGGACAVGSCNANTWDEDLQASTGCEYGCTLTNGGVEICNGDDDDCNGETDSLDVALDDPSEVNSDCGGREHPLATNVAAWFCGSGACGIASCIPDWWHNDSDLDNGCEYGCTAAGNEICDGDDDDCDGDIDAADPDLDVAADCGGRVCAANCGDVTGWSCSGGCIITGCNSNIDANKDPTDGCECSAAGAEICDGIDNDCDGDLDAADVDLDVNADCGGRVCSSNCAEVSGWACSGGSCHTTACSANIDANGDPTDGCECVPARETCNGGDDDCDGDIDAADADLDEPGELKADCESAGHYPAAQNVRVWRCASVCEIETCEANYHHVDGDVSNGCEYSCTITTTVCDGNDDNCDGDPTDGCGVTVTPLDQSGAGLVDDTITSVTVDGSGNLWVGTGVDGGVSYLPEGGGAFQTVTGLKSAPINDVIIDGAGHAWLGFEEGACDVAVCDCGPQRVSGFPGSPTVDSHCTDTLTTSENQVPSMAYDSSNGDIYVGTRNDYGIYKEGLDAVDCDIELGGVGGGAAQAMIVDRASPASLWVGTQTYLAECSTNIHTDVAGVCGETCQARDGFPTVDDDISGFAIDDQGTASAADDILWISSHASGLAQFSLATDTSAAVYTTATSNIPSNVARDVVSDGTSIFVATDAGLARYFPATDVWITYDSSDGLPSDDLTSLAIDTARNVLWVGTAGDGVAKVEL